MKLAKISLLVLGAVLPAAVNATKDDMKNGNCAYNMYMCCWTENDGQGMQDNTDVCYVDGQFITKEEQVDTHCHGFAWQDGADHDTYIAPLHQYVKNFDHKDQRGYYGRIKGGRQCGCTEDMPIVERADCTTIDYYGNFKACPGNDLYGGYKQQGLDSTKTAYPPNPNRDGDCAGADYAKLVAPEENQGHFNVGGGDTVVTSSTTSDYRDGRGFIREGETFAPTPAPTSLDEVTAKVHACAYNMYMCCFTENDGNGMEDNTDVCYVDGKFVTEEEQVDTHCHGFAWQDGADYDTYIHPLYHYVRTFDHKGQRGYYGRIDGGRQCGCTEDMPIVERADCTTIDYYGNFKACPGNDLYRGYKQQGLDSTKTEYPPNPNRDGDCDGAAYACDLAPVENQGHYIEGGGSTDLTSSTTSDYIDGKGYIREGETFAPTPAPTAVEDRSAKVYGCAYNMYMCCWTENDGNGMEDNTDVCYVDGKFIPEEEQVDTHCHGFAWKNGADYETYKKPLYDYVRTYDHKGQRGYYGRIEGGRQCACAEDMPVVERADCTTIDDKGNFVECPGNDLMNQYVACGRPGGFWTPNPSAWGSCSSAETAADLYTADENKGHHKEGGGRTDLTSDSTSYMNSQGEWVRGEDFMDYTDAPSPAPTPGTAAPTGAPTPTPTPAPTSASTTTAPITAAPTTAAPVPAAAKPEETPSPSEEMEYSYIFDYETPSPTQYDPHKYHNHSLRGRRVEEAP